MPLIVSKCLAFELSISYSITTWMGKSCPLFKYAGLLLIVDSGYAECSKFDTLGKNAIEYLRAKSVDLPWKFVNRGRI